MNIFSNKILKKTAFIYIFAVFLLILDIILKNLAINKLQNHDIKIIGDIFKLSLAKNTGIAFSLPLSGPILNIITALIILFLLFYYIKIIQKKQEKFILPLTILIFGAIINFVDRIKLGYVIDYFNLKWFTVFNVADVMIFISIIYIALISWKTE